MYDNEVLDALIVRNGQEMHVKVPTVPTEDLETDRAVVFCGAVLQKPHHAVRQQISKLHSEIYISARVRPLHHFAEFIWLIWTEPRFACIPVWIIAYELHHGSQRCSDPWPWQLCTRSQEDPRQHILPSSSSYLWQCAVGSHHEKERSLRESILPYLL